MKTLRFIILLLLVPAALAALVFFAAAIVTDYRPDEVEIIAQDSPEPLPDSVRIVTWNIGYAGLGDNMDFFYDGGRRVRDTRERTRGNLDSIISHLRRENADIYLLQEVDAGSKRTYGTDMCAALAEAFPGYHLYFAPNYKCFFVPIPLSEPIGKVESGVVILSRFRPLRVCRMSYPSRFPFPVSMFNLKRCLLTAEFLLADGRTAVVANTHNTAYDTGGMRGKETDFLASLAAGWSAEGIPFVVGGDWNQYPQGYVPEAVETDNEYFQVAPLSMERLGLYGETVHDAASKTLRYLNEPYSEHSICTVTDFFYVSGGMRHSRASTAPLGYKNSDHLPVSVTVWPENDAFCH